LEPYSSEAYFWQTLYNGHYGRLLKKAEEFVEATGGAGEDVLVFIRFVGSVSFSFLSQLYGPYVT
jgi:hypothetical protein